MRRWAYQTFRREGVLHFVAMATPEDVAANAECVPNCLLARSGIRPRPPHTQAGVTQALGPARSGIDEPRQLVPTCGAVCDLARGLGPKFEAAKCQDATSWSTTEQYACWLR
jgi:hypothetical protein